ncbi:hypothetical protein LTR84_002887 [Exophiala bonariae]|uniref:Uncharacterized protein n=1 Tax=Exophiala bonariae TaxID=1690606 RepID=A0AAV9NDN0_9EURO|nr:hypothetical protein LTR84_002887 [Exophiala bonariae]
MAPSLREFGRKTSSLFFRDDNRSSKQPSRFTILPGIDDEESESDEAGPSGMNNPEQETPRPAATFSILRYINTNFTPGSSIADLDPEEAEAINRCDIHTQIIREVDNMATQPISSSLISMNARHANEPIHEHTDNSPSGGTSSAAFRKHQSGKAVSPSYHRHQAKSSVPEGLEKDFYQSLRQQQNVSKSSEGVENVTMRSVRERLASMSSIASTTESEREDRLRGKLVRTGSMNWQVTGVERTDTTGEATQEINHTPTGLTIQARVESHHPSANRPWDDFSESEFAGDSQREVVQVAPGQWELASRRNINPTYQLRQDYRPMHPNQMLPEQLYPETSVFAGDNPTRNARADPYTNPLWRPQYEHPVIQNLNAAVQHASTDIHALWKENQVLTRQAAEDAQRIEELQRQIARLTAMMQTTGLGHAVPERREQREGSNIGESETGTRNQADDEVTSEST